MLRLLSLFGALCLAGSTASADVRVKSATVTTSTSAYTANDQIGGVVSIPSALAGTFGGRITSVSVSDKSGQKPALNILFFRASPTLASSDNAALDISDAEMAAKYIGAVPIATANYLTLSGGAASTGAALANDLVVQSSDDTLYAVVQAVGTPTFTGTSDLTINVGIVRE